MLNALVDDGLTNDCVSELAVVSVTEGFDPEVLPLISGVVKVVDSGELNVEDSENMGSMLVVMDVSSGNDSEVASLADTVEALRYGAPVVKLLPEVEAVVGGASEEATELSEDTRKDSEAEIEEPRDGDFTSPVDVRGASEVV